MSTFERENRYAIIKWKDIEKTLSLSEIDDLRHILWKINDYRISEKKTPIEAVVVEHDWPEYEIVWKMIEERMNSENIILNTGDM